MGRLIRGIVGLCAAIGLCASTSQAVLIKDTGLIVDTTTGLQWVPVSHTSGALAIEDLEPGFRYATNSEVGTLLDTYVFTLPGPCDLNGSPFCSPAAYQAIVDFIDIFQAEMSLPPHTLRGVYDPVGTKDSGIAMFLTLYGTGEGGIYLDRQSTHYPPIRGDDFGMFLVSTVPEPSTFALWCGGILLLWVLRKRR